ncbi:unnamed protein product, partial [marine sediment metagenome]
YFLSNNIFSGSAPDADIVTASFGNQFEDWWTRGIESMAERYGLIVVAGIGNGSHVYDSLLYPGAGANVIGVGVVDSVKTENLSTNLAQFCLAYPEHSSLGPTNDGRCKPDIVAPGNCLAADANEPNRYEPTDNWSSFSTPIVAGTIGLLVQKAKQDTSLSPAISPDSGNCVIKAILLNSATKLPYWHKGRLETDDDHQVPLDYMQGAGMLNAVGAYEHLIAGMKKPGDAATIGWDLNELQKDENPLNFYRITIAEPADNLLPLRLFGTSIMKALILLSHYPRKTPICDLNCGLLTQRIPKTTTCSTTATAGLTTSSTFTTRQMPITPIMKSQFSTVTSTRRTSQTQPSDMA